MCTIHTFDGTNADTKDRHLQQIIEDWKTNGDGGSVIILDDHNEVTVRFQTTKLKHLVSCIKSSKGTRYVVHLRHSTTPQTGVGGCHMFDSPQGEWIYCHNGIVHNPKNYRVDSISLGDSLDKEALSAPQVDTILPDWSHHNFANVIAYSTLSCEIFVHRSYNGSLHHDGNGNWSSKAIDRNYLSVSPGWYTLTGEPLLQYPESRVYRFGGSNYYRYLPSLAESFDMPEFLESQDGTEYRTCDDCGVYEKTDDMLTHGGDTLCPHCYAYNTQRGLK